MVTARILPFNDATIAEAAQRIADGQPVAIPTETVYGLAADATRGDAVAGIYAAKGRPSFNPLIVHVLDFAATEVIADLPPVATLLARHFWPGPLSIVAPLAPGNPIASLATAGLPTIALRSPAHPAMRALLQACGKPLAAPSANASNGISPTRADHVARSLGDRVPLIVDDGPTALGLESTIVSASHDTVTILRHGPIDASDLARVTGLRVIAPASGPIIAPGQLRQHYAPSKPLRLEAVRPVPDEWLIGFGPVQGHASLSPNGNLSEAAANLFDLLHRADMAALPRIAVAPIPAIGLGLAINDRLQRAAA